MSTSISLPSFLSGTEATAPPPLLNDRWEVSNSCAHELYHTLAAIFLSITSSILSCLCLQTLSKRIHVLSEHEFSEAAFPKLHSLFQKQILARAINTHRKDTEEFYSTCFHPNGICRGMCHWFISLYFQTKSHFIDPIEHLRAVGRQFEAGAPAQAAFLHSPHVLTPEVFRLLKCEIKEDEKKICTRGKDIDEILQEWTSCPPGVFGVYLAKHMLVYIKLSEEKQFLFDPSRYTLDVSSPLLFKKAIEKYLKQHDLKLPILIDRFTAA